jgi:formylglycine-generating enzyme
MKRHALIVGINRYSDSSIAPLHCATNDAQEIKWTLERRCGFELVRCLLDDQAVADRILEEIVTMSSSLGAGDLLFFFFAGHGYENAAQGPLLLGADCQRIMLNAGVQKGIVPLRGIEKLTAGCGAGRLLVLDACRERLEDGRRSTGKGMNEVTKRDIGAVVDSATDNPPLCVVYSCDTGQLACELKHMQSGVFTKALCNVMANCIVEGNDLLLPRDFDTVQNETDRLIREHLPGERQNPWYKANCKSIPIIGTTADSSSLQARYEEKLTEETGKQQGRWYEDREDFRDFLEDLRAEGLAKGKRTAEIRRDLQAALKKWREEHGVADEPAPPVPPAKQTKVDGPPPLPTPEPATGGPAPPPLPGAGRDGRLQEWGLEAVRTRYADVSRLAEGSRKAQNAQTHDASKLRLPLAVRCRVSHIEMRLVPAGSCHIGSPEDEAARGAGEDRREITVPHPLYVSAYPITRERWKRVMGHDPSRFLHASVYAPVENVTWNQCREFLRRLCELEGVGSNTYRLLTSGEWEYACRAGTQTALYTGDLEIAGLNNAPALDPVGWYAGNCGVTYEGGVEAFRWPERQKDHDRAGTHPVGEKLPNAWGIYDTIGNVWEWCADAGADGGHVIRGGSWFCNARFCRAACRMTAPHAHASNQIGLRIAVEAPR